MSSNLGGTAVVIGAGIAGLSAAQALADFFDAVVVLERDEPPSADRPRPGAPQGSQAHLLLAGGFQALSDLVPGFGQDLQAAGAVPYTVGQDIRSEIPGLGALPKREIALSSFATTRPRLEQVLFRRVAARGNVHVRHGSRVAGIRTAFDGSHVTGVRYEGPDGELRELGADLVVDASGRAVLTTACLEAAGREPPRQTTIGVDMGYSTGVFFIPDSVGLDFVAVATLPQAPEDSRGGYMLRIGEGLWQVSLAGRGEERPPGDIEAFLAFAGALPTRTIANALEHAGLPDEITRFGLRASVRRHFDGTSLPHGLLAVGDSLCRFNPVYGQGMSVAAQQASLLRDLLTSRAGTPAPLKGLAAEFLPAADALIEAAWQFSAIPDLAYPQSEGERPADLEEKLQLQGEMFGRAMDDPEAHRALMERMHLLAPVTSGPRPVELA